jgi:hypothetical protein
MEKVKVARAKVKNAKWFYIVLAVTANITLIINAIHHW